jgi:hypothetical protein
MVCVCRLITPMFSNSHARVRYAACQCVYVLLLVALFACANHSRLQWTAMYGLGGNTTRVFQTDVNYANGADYGKLRMKAMECIGLIGPSSLSFYCFGDLVY